MIRIQYDVFVSIYNHFDHLLINDTGGRDNDADDYEIILIIMKMM